MCQKLNEKKTMSLHSALMNMHRILIAFLAVACVQSLVVNLENSQWR